jgi:2-oxoisovalerate dehydrogenase E2 component (dihydrolipoyl transacylase)
MDIFNLPDLGEGLPDAEIHEWFVKEGDVVEVDQPLVAMETAKAVVEVPSPQRGTIAVLYGKSGDIIKTGAPLVKFSTEVSRTDQGTVVGHLEESQEHTTDHFIIGTTSSRPKATPSIRRLAKQWGISLSDVVGSGLGGVITREDLEKQRAHSTPLSEGFEPLKGVRRAMLQSMTQSHQEVVPVSIFDEADVSCWIETGDITVRLIRALSSAAKKEPALNAWFDKIHNARKCFDKINLGLAMDTEDGLFVPVMKNVEQQTDESLREEINKLKQAVKERSLSPEKFQDATITLSNFGKFAGRFASPIIVPPMVSILAVGRLFEKPLYKNNEIRIAKILPLSLSFDHRAVTGGEATRFLGAIIEALEK